jgi:sulfite reductase beta subunit-like hemoprotein
VEVLKKEERIFLKYGRRKKKKEAEYKVLKKELGFKEIDEARFLNFF